MALDFTVVTAVRQRFGESNVIDDAWNIGLEADAPFVGLEKIFEFDCPDVNPGESAILLFESQGVDVRQTLEINGQQVFGGLPFTPLSAPLTASARGWAAWTGNVMLINPGMLQSQANVLRIASTATLLPLDDGGRIDSFVVDNMVVVFKTVGSRSIAPPRSRQKKTRRTKR